MAKSLKAVVYLYAPGSYKGTEYNGVQAGAVVIGKEKAKPFRCVGDMLSKIQTAYIKEFKSENRI